MATMTGEENVVSDDRNVSIVASLRSLNVLENMFTHSVTTHAAKMIMVKEPKGKKRKVDSLALGYRFSSKPDEPIYEELISSSVVAVATMSDELCEAIICDLEKREKKAMISRKNRLSKLGLKETATIHQIKLRQFMLNNARKNI